MNDQVVEHLRLLHKKLNALLLEVDKSIVDDIRKTVIDIEDALEAHRKSVN
jgi:hypothetical protein